VVVFRFFYKLKSTSHTRCSPPGTGALQKLLKIIRNFASQFF
jgi:hypothetical protein